MGSEALRSLLCQPVDSTKAAKARLRFLIKNRVQRYIRADFSELKSVMRSCIARRASLKNYKNFAREA